MCPCICSPDSDFGCYLSGPLISVFIDFLITFAGEVLLKVVSDGSFALLLIISLLKTAPVFLCPDP